MARLHQFNCLIQALRMIVGVVDQIRRRGYYVTTVMILTMQQFEPRLTKKLFLPQKFRNPLDNQWIEVRTGTPPQTLQQVMQRWEGDRVKKSPQTSFNRLINLVRSGKPAIALVRVGGLSIPYIGSIPYLHWIVVTGADPQSQQITYTDTNSQTYVLSYQDFQTMWNLGLDRDVSGAIASVLKSNGVEARTIVWVDK